MDSKGLKLTAAQVKPFHAVFKAAQSSPKGRILHVGGKGGCGITTILRALNDALDSAFVDMKDLLPVMTGSHPLAIEESMANLIIGALGQNEVVIVDDLGLLCDVVGSCAHFTPRRQFINAVMKVVVSTVRDQEKTLILGGKPLPEPLKKNWSWGIEEYRAEDYRTIAEAYLNEEAHKEVDFEKVYRFAPELDGHGLRSAFGWLALSDEPLNAERVIEYLKGRQMSSNVHLRDVDRVQLSSLKGIDSVIESLEANIILPLENDSLATELGLKPRKGVLLVGPPGTGKTTIGKALAHRLKGKFFLVDGTVVSGTKDFHFEINSIFEAAESNSPAVVFIDDSDVIFQGKEALGLYRYLLTMLDGLEGKGGHVCLILTAMDVADVPPALVRSGRVELWLETRLPDSLARANILKERIALCGDTFAGLDVETLADSIDGFSGADVRRLVEDAKALLAYDINREMKRESPGIYFERAVATLREYKKKSAEVESLQRAPQE